MRKASFRFSLVFTFLFTILFAVPTSAVVYIPAYVGKVTAKNTQNQTIEILVIDGVNNCGTDKIGETLSAVPRNSAAFVGVEIGDYVSAAGTGTDWHTIAKLKSKTERVITDLYGDMWFGGICATFSDGLPFLGNYTLDLNFTQNCSTDPPTMEDPKIIITKPSGETHTENLTLGELYKYKDGQYAIDITFEGGSPGSCAIGAQAISNFVISITETEQTGLPVGTLLYRTSGNNEMPGRVGSPTNGALNFPYLQIPCAIYCGMLYSDDWITTSDRKRILWESCPEEERPFPPTRTGHVAIYIGEIDGEHKIIEAGGNFKKNLQIFPQINIAPLNTFVDEGHGQVFIGAKFPTGIDVHGHSLPSNWQANIVGLAEEHEGEDYDLDFNLQKGETGGDWICVGFAEKLYESCNLEPKLTGERPLTFFEPYPYGTTGTQFYGGYDITRDGFYDSGETGGLINSYSYSGNDGYFRRCEEICSATNPFQAYVTFSNHYEFSRVTHPRNDEYDTTCGNNYNIGRENDGRIHIFWPYTQFKQDTLKSIRTTLDAGTTVVNIVGGPSKANPVTVFPGCGKTVEIEVEVMRRDGSKIESSQLKTSNFVVSLEKNEDGRCVAMPCQYNTVTGEVYFFASNIPYTSMGCGTYELRVDYKDASGVMRSSYSQDNSLIITNVGESSQIQGITLHSGTTSEYVSTKSLTIGPDIIVEDGASVTFKAPKVEVKSKSIFRNGAKVKIDQ